MKKLTEGTHIFLFFFVIIAPKKTLHFIMPKLFKLKNLTPYLLF